MNENQKYQALIARVADGIVNIDDDLSYLQDQQFTDNLKTLSALKAAFSDANKQVPNNNDSKIPQRWGHLKINSQIGQGSFGTVYSAFDTVLQREVALKLRRISRQDMSANNYILEARRLARVIHPNVLSIHGADIHDNRVGLWSDLVDGETLQTKLNRSDVFSTDEIIGIAEQLVNALNAIHEQDLVHGDVKAENVMLSKSRLILMDFGAAQRMGRPATFGSPLSMAPEQIEGSAVSEATDIYSLGALLYSMCTKQSLSMTENGADKLESSLDKRLLKKKSGKTLAKLITSMLYFEPKLRPNTKTIIQVLTDIKTQPVRRLKAGAVTTVIVSLITALLISMFATKRAEKEFRSSEAVKNLVIKSMDTLRPQNNFGPHVIAKMYKNMAKQARTELADFPGAQAGLLVTIGTTLFDIGSQNEGIALVEEGLLLKLQTTPVYPMELASIYSILSKFRRDLEDYENAESALNKAFYYTSQIENKDSVEAQKHIIRLYTTKANLKGRLGDWHGRLKLNMQLLELRKKLVGDDDPWLAIDHYHIGQSLLFLNRFAEALAAFKQAEDYLSKEGDRESTRFLHVKTGIMDSYIHLGKSKDARRLLKFLRQRYPLLLAESHHIFTTLDVHESRIIALEGDLIEASTKLRQLLEKDSVPFANAYRIKLILIKNSIALNQWQQVHVYLNDVLKKPHKPYTPLFPYLAAASSYVRYQIEKTPIENTATSPMAELESAMSIMRKQGYDNLEEYKNLQTWKEKLLVSIKENKQ